MINPFSESFFFWDKNPFPNPNFIQYYYIHTHTHLSPIVFCVQVKYLTCTKNLLLFNIQYKDRFFTCWMATWRKLLGKPIFVLYICWRKVENLSFLFFFSFFDRKTYLCVVIHMLPEGGKLIFVYYIY